MKLIKTPDNLKKYFTDEQWTRMKQELDNQTEEDTQDIKREIEEDYEKIYGKKFNWNDMDELVKELESYTK